MGLVCASDFVVAAQSAKFMAGATRVAMVPDAGVTVTLTQLVGLRRAMEILMLNPVIDAAQALEMGLITRVAPIAASPISAVRACCLPGKGGRSRVDTDSRIHPPWPS